VTLFTLGGSGWRTSRLMAYASRSVHRFRSQFLQSGSLEASASVLRHNGRPRDHEEFAIDIWNIVPHFCLRWQFGTSTLISIVCELGCFFVLSGSSEAGAGPAFS
jgi:hypothetical protein